MDQSVMCDTEFEELYHHGVIGQKWGVRRYQNEDGSLTEQGKEHYGYEPSSKKSSAKRVAAILGGTAALGLGVASGAYLTKKLMDKPEPQPIVVQRPKLKKEPKTVSESLDSATELLKKINNFGREANSVEDTAKKSSLVKKVLGLKDEKDGGNDGKGKKNDDQNKGGKIKDKPADKKSLKDVNENLDDLIKTVTKTNELADAGKVLSDKVTGTIGKATSNVASEMQRGRVTIDPNDSVIKKGQKMTNLSLNELGPQHTAMWVTDNKSDTEFYRGVYGAKLITESVKKRGIAPQSLYEHNFTTTQDIKVAGKNRASKVFADLYNSSDEAKEEFWKRADYYKEKHPESFTRAYDKLKNATPENFDKVLKNEGYMIFNSGLVNDYGTEKLNGRTYQFGDTGSKFYDRLRKEGYGAVEDVFDKKYSSYHTISPKIVFADRGTDGNKAVQKNDTVTVTIPDVVEKLAENAPTWGARQRRILE